jgi:hypothetical protein
MKRYAEMIRPMPEVFPTALEENEQSEFADFEPGMDDVVDMLLEDHLTEGEEGIEELAADLGSGGMQNLIDKMFSARLAEGDNCWRHS